MLDVGADIGPMLGIFCNTRLWGPRTREPVWLLRARVGLLNVGTEDNKGRPELREAHALISQNAEDHDFTFVGFVEGGDIPGTKADVIITDGFTDNIAMKTGEDGQPDRFGAARAFSSHPCLVWRKYWPSPLCFGFENAWIQAGKWRRVS